MYAVRRRRASVLQVTVTSVLVALLLLLGMASITRYAQGAPLLPPGVAKAMHRPASQLPPGLTYSFDVLDPQTLKPLSELPQLGTVELRLAVTNDSALPMDFSFRNALQCEFVARRIHTYLGGLFALPLEVWRSSYFHNVSQRPTRLKLQPGQTKVYESYWQITQFKAADLAAGEYLLTAHFQTTTLPPLRIEKPL